METQGASRVCLELLLNCLLGVMSQVTVQQLVGVDLHQVQHGQSTRVLVNLQGSDVTFLHTTNYRPYKCSDNVLVSIVI